MRRRRPFQFVPRETIAAAAARAPRVDAKRFRADVDGEWLRENRAGFDAYNERIDEHGLFSDGLRGF